MVRRIGPWSCGEALQRRSATRRKMNSEPTILLKDKKKIHSVSNRFLCTSFIVCLLCPFLDAETTWSSWRTCNQSNGNVCRCQTRRCQDKGNTPCLTDVEVRLENCTGNYKNLISSLTVIMTFFLLTPFLCSYMIRR